MLKPLPQDPSAPSNLTPAQSLDCSPQLLATLQNEVLGVYQRAPGRAEAGGVLWGVRDEGVLRVVAHEPFVRQEPENQSFVLSPNELIAFGAWRSKRPARAGLIVVGWYRSHTDATLALSLEDRLLHRRFFGVGDVALLLHLQPGKPTQAAFFLPRDPLAALPDRVWRIFTLDAAWESKPPDPQRAAETEADGNLLATAIWPAYRNGVPVPLPAPRRRWPWLAGALALLLVLAGAGAWWMRPLQTQPSPFALAAKDENGQVRITWNTHAAAFAQARNAVLQIEDGARKTRWQFDGEALRAGQMTYTRRGERVRIGLMVQPPQGEGLSEWVSLEGPVLVSATVPAAAPPPEAVPASPPVAAPTPAATDSPQPAIKKKPSDEDEDEDAEEAPATKPGQTPTQATIPAAQRALPVMTVPVAPPVLQPGEATATTAETPSWAASLPHPGIRPEPPPPPKVMPSTPVVDPAAAALASYHGPRSGRVIWKGDLLRNGDLVLTNGQPSVGKILGLLPPVPMRLKARAAEQKRQGLTIFTDADQAGPAGRQKMAAPGTRTVWYEDSPEHAGDISVVEVPSQKNGWSRLVIRAEQRAVRVVVIDWEIAGGEKR